MAEIIEIGDGVVAGLNAATFRKKFVAAREYIAEFELAELEDVKVVVGAMRQRRRRHSRAAWERDYDVQVAVVERSGLSRQELDKLVDLPEEIATWADEHEMEACPQANLFEIDIAEPYAVSALQTQSVFLTMVTLTYRVWR